MMFVMNTKTFFDNYLQNENYADILKAQYVCISCKIRRKSDDFDNILIANNTLFPNSNVLNKGSFDDMEDEYYEQLSHETQNTLIASLIKGAIEENLNIIFLCTKNESRLRYLKWLQNYIFMEFNYPVYDYKDFVNGCGIIKYNRDKILKKVNKIVKKGEEKYIEANKNNKSGRKIIMRRYASCKKSELKKILKEKGLYSKDMSKDEMLDMLDAFL